MAYVQATLVALFTSAEGGGYVTAGVCVAKKTPKFITG